MIAVSNAWKDIQHRFLLPETYVEIKCAITESGIQDDATASGTNEAVWSDISKVPLESEDNLSAKKYATHELNLWMLDGSMEILPDSEPYSSAGYVSDIEATGSVTIMLPEVHNVAIPGVTILWSSEFEEYPTVFTVTAKNGDTVVAETTVTGNTQHRCLVDLELTNYDRVVVTVHEWCLPNRRPRLERVSLGHTMLLTKHDILSYTHEQHGDLLCGEVPKNSIEFSIDNIDGRWNPSNPTGMERYLSERQKVTVRYGLDVDGVIEWIKAGTFYLSEWSAPANGLEARFVARDLFEFLLGVEMKGSVYSSLYSLITYDATYQIIPDDAGLVVDESLKDYTVEYLGANTAAEIVQKGANAARCILRYDRDGVLHVEPFNNTLTDYRIPLTLSYAHPEITLSKPLKKVAVDYGESAPYELSVSGEGESQSVNNDFIGSKEQAIAVAEWVRDVLQHRKTVSGEFRADPRLDLYDVVVVESKYGALTPVAITNIKYTFNGSFKGTYTGKILDI